MNIERKTLCFRQIAMKSPSNLWFFAVFSMWAMNKYCTMAVCPNESKKRLDLNYCLFSVKSYDRENQEVFCKRAEKKFKRLIDPGICSLHFKETDIAITFLSIKIFLQAAIRLSLTPKLIDRGYPETLIMSTHSVIKFEDRKLALQQRCKEDKQIFPFV